jgi:hypothetical protein
VQSLEASVLVGGQICSHSAPLAVEIIGGKFIAFGLRF